MSHKKATWLMAGFIMIGGVLCSLSQGYGLLSGVKLPFWNFQTGIVYYNIYDWVDCFTGYILLPIGCLLTAIYISKIWGFEEYEKELTKEGRDGKLSKYDKFICKYVVPVLVLVVILNVFGFIQ